MPVRLQFTDAASAADAVTFAGRASRLTEEAVRLQAARGVLAMTAAPLAPRGLGDSTPTILAMRALAVDPELECDLVVTASSLEVAADDSTAVILPPTAVSAAWAGVAPPRSGWEPADGMDASVLATRAQAGIAEVAHKLPADPGEDVVRAVRAAVWGAPDDALGGLPHGVAFAAYALGFINGAETVRVLRNGRWTRLSLQRGHVLVRGPVASGLTAVRTTGPASAD